MMRWGYLDQDQSLILIQITAKDAPLSSLFIDADLGKLVLFANFKYNTNFIRVETFEKDHSLDLIGTMPHVNSCVTDSVIIVLTQIKEETDQGVKLHGKIRFPICQRQVNSCFR